MKIILFILALSQFSFAQTYIEVRPTFPVSCQSSDGGLINWHQKIQKVSETATEVVFEFLTSYGTCKGGKTVAYKTLELASVGAFRNGLFAPWKKDGVEAEIAVSTDSDHLVRLRFDKSILFKKKLERKFTFLFRPGIYRTYIVQGQFGMTQQNVPFEFPWNVVLSVDTVSDTASLKFL